MAFYLPIAEVSLDIFLLLGLGTAVGLLSGMFGVGGGFLMTPLLIFVGVPPAVAVATGANLITASSVSGAMAFWRRGGVDLRMGLVLSLGGGFGAIAGGLIFVWLRTAGQIELVIGLAYVLFLGTIGLLMLRESLLAIWRTRRGGATRRRPGSARRWFRVLPLRMRFHKSRLYMSALVPLVLGAAVGLLAAILGIGGGFAMIPAMIYILGMPTSVVVGTSLLQIVFVTALITLMHAIGTQSVDVLLTLLLLPGAVFGAQIGVRLGQRLESRYLRALLALIVLGVGARMAADLVVEPADLYSVAAAVP